MICLKIIKTIINMGFQQSINVHVVTEKSIHLSMKEDVYTSSLLLTLPIVFLGNNNS
jgi:hypothetical protein